VKSEQQRSLVLRRASVARLAWGTLAAIAACFGTTAASATCANPKALGVSRIVEIDTANGPRLGHQQYRDVEFLSEGEVVLTFDDGPLRPYTQPVLDALSQHCTMATFFIVGQQALHDPAMVKEIARRGHTVGTHTWSHQNLKKLTPLKARAEIELGFSAVQQALGKPVAPFFRFPYLSDPKSMLGHLQTRGIGAFSIEVDSNDYKSPDPDLLIRTVMSQLADKRKGIVLMHDIQVSTARAMPNLLTQLKAKGYRVVHLRSAAPATTLPDFDAAAKSPASRAKIASSTQPETQTRVIEGVAGAPAVDVQDPINAPRTLPQRTITGQIPRPDRLPWATSSTGRSAVGQPVPSTGSGHQAGQQAPGAVTQQGVVERPQPIPRPSRIQTNEPDWRARVFAR
jgi:peptidoglycan-N-acetylglucosamine deacetylase